jgi:hypothetical protein
MQQQLPLFLVAHRWLPDGRKPILHQQSQNVSGIGSGANGVDYINVLEQMGRQ